MDFLLLALSAFGLGALHVLEPGHGKTVMGAYLVGSKGRVSDAILLGIIVTLAHSGSVIILAVLSMIASVYFVPEMVEKILGVVSGLLIIAIGIWMLFVRVRQARRHENHHHSDSHEHDHDHENYEHHHEHSHPHIPDLKPGQRPTFAQLVALGVSGGIVPCHSALAVLLAAISLGEFARALILVVIHSIGMASVLVAIGIAMVKAADIAGKYVSESKWTRYVPVVSTIIVLLMGIGMTVRAMIAVL